MMRDRIINHDKVSRVDRSFMWRRCGAVFTELYRQGYEPKQSRVA